MKYKRNLYRYSESEYCGRKLFSDNFLDIQNNQPQYFQML